MTRRSSLPAYDDRVSAPTARRPLGLGHRSRTPVLALVALVASLLLTLTPNAPAVAAPAAANPLSVAVTTVEVSGGAPDDTVAVHGRVTNNTGQPAYDVRVQLWRSIEQVRSLSSVLDALETDRPPAGRLLRDKPSEIAVLTGPAAALAPGASITFTVSGTVSDLDWRGDSSYWIGARVTGATRPNGTAQSSLASQAVTLTTIPGTALDAVVPAVATVVELSAPPTRLRRNLFATDALASDLTSGGRLGRLLAVAEQPGMSWAVDPALLDEVADMADGYKVLADQGTADGTGAQVASAWLADFDKLSASNGVRTLYGRPDLVGPGSDLRVFDRALSVTPARVSSLPVVALASRVSTPMLDAAASRHVPVLTTAAGIGRSSLSIAGAHVLAMTSLDTLWPSPLIVDSPDARGAASIALARVSGAQVRLIRSPDDAAAVTTTPTWVKRVPISTVLAEKPTTVSAEIASPLTAAGAVDARVSARLARLQANLLAYGAASPATGLKELAAELASNGASESWLDAPASRERFIAGVEEATGASLMAKGVTLTAPVTVTMSSASSQFPATITNPLPEPIKVRVVGISASSPRMRVSPSELVTIRPHDSFTVQVPAEARTNGAVQVTLRVEAEDGTVVSAPFKTTLEATNLGFVGWLIVGASGLVLLVTTALRIRQVRRRQTP